LIVDSRQAARQRVETIGYADVSGNRQNISVGNLSGDDQVAPLLMDYPGQRRARVERGVIIRVESFDWSCPKYIAPRLELVGGRRQETAMRDSTAPGTDRIGSATLR
jgi:hypothetical protein